MTEKAMEARAAFLAGALTEKVAIYVPGTCGVDTAADTSEHVNRIASELSSLFGGASAQVVSGYWLSPVAGLVQEKTTVVYSFCTPDALADHIGEVEKLARQLCRELHQEAVTVEAFGACKFVEA